MSELIPVLSEEEITQKLEELGKKITEDYKGEKLVVLGVLKGSFIFMADLVRKIDLKCELDFIGASSYGLNDETSGSVKITKNISIDVKDKHVLLVEDIIDTGITIEFLKKYLKDSGAKSIKVCTLLDKYERREKSVEVDYVCHKINEGFIVGYGIDYAEQYRNLPAIYHLKT